MYVPFVGGLIYLEFMFGTNSTQPVGWPLLIMFHILILSNGPLIDFSILWVQMPPTNGEYASTEWIRMEVVMELPSKLGLGTIFLTYGGIGFTRTHVQRLGMGMERC